MRALLKQNGTVSVQNIARPTIEKEDDIVIHIKLAGLCRTDVFVADGLIDGKDELVLGHEFAGIVTEAGANSNGLKTGDRVTVMPVMPCGTCALCTNGKKDSCQNTTMLGIDYDGAFAEYIKVPANTVYALPESVTFKQGAYSEPLAAAMSVLKSDIQPTQKGFIYGQNRFSQLIARILKARGFQDITIHDPNSGTLDENSYDFGIETLATTDAMQDIIKAIRPQGKIIIKSRKHEPVGIPFHLAVQKEVTLQAVNYGDFAEAVDLLANENFDVDDLLGDIYELEDFETVFENSKTKETSKIFFKPGTEPCAD